LHYRKICWISLMDHGRAIRQTLEPRAFYLRTPFANQSMLPLYDTGATDFNLSTIYSANPYVGQDRVADNNLLTLGVTSRYLDANTGAELAKFGFAQRLRFDDQRVTLPSESLVAKGFSDMLVGAGVRWDDRWSLDSLVQFNNQTYRSVRTTVGARYSPTPYRVLNMAYRMTRDQSEQIDVGWQWPLGDFSWSAVPENSLPPEPGQGLGPGRWHSVGRIAIVEVDAQPEVKKPVAVVVAQARVAVAYEPNVCATTFWSIYHETPAESRPIMPFVY
jgi:LPS-assembly protein